MAAQAQTTGTASEHVVWTDHPSHVEFLGRYILCALLSPLVIPIFVAMYYWLLLRSRRYELTNQRLLFSHGIISKTREEWELYRIKDMRIEQPFKLRMFGKGNIVLQTSDRTMPDFTIAAVDSPQALADQIRKLVEARRDSKGVREVDME
jgi:uncharacterized membrane protein YdbT with pleckstrin-like domain